MPRNHRRTIVALQLGTLALLTGPVAHGTADATPTAGVCTPLPGGNTRACAEPVGPGNDTGDDLDGAHTPDFGNYSDVLPDLDPPDLAIPLSKARGATACLGVYNGGQRTADHETNDHFGSYPAAANTYYQPTESIAVGTETSRIRRGTSPNITITSKGTNYIHALGTGWLHPGYRRARAWLDAYIDGLAQLAAIDPDVPVYATLEHEFKVKVRTGMVTGPSADPAQYGRALNLFYWLAERAHPNIRTTYWIVGYDRKFEGAVAQRFTTLPDAILFDPYADQAGETIASITTGDLAWIRGQDWYVGQEIALGEFGMPIRYGDAAMAGFYTNVPARLAELGISWAVFFNRERDNDHRIIDRTDYRTFPRAVSAFSNSLEASC